MAEATTAKDDVAGVDMWIYAKQDENKGGKDGKAGKDSSDGKKWNLLFGIQVKPSSFFYSKEDYVADTYLKITDS